MELEKRNIQLLMTPSFEKVFNKKALTKRGVKTHDLFLVLSSIHIALLTLGFHRFACSSDNSTVPCRWSAIESFHCSSLTD